MHRRFLVRSAVAAALNVAAIAPVVGSDRSASPDAWWSALDASLPPDVAVERTKVAGNQPPPPDTWPPGLWRPPPATWQPPPVPPIPQWTGEFGGRYWFSSGRTQFDLYDPTGTVALSRLTYTGLQAQSGEAFGRLEHLTGFFIKGYAGGGAITTGNLQDEDFPPAVVPYSSTSSDQRDGRLAYATIDAGWTWRGDLSKLGFFLGYNYFHELVNAVGCTQTASNPLVCNPTLPASVLGITDEWNWNAIRLGFNGQWRFWGGFAFDLDFAWLPHAWLDASDTHWQRVPSFTVPESGGSSFSSVQIDALLRYQFVNGFALGVGVRYWKLDTGFAQAFFNESSLGGLPQTISLHSELWGPFIQASYKFGELRPTRY